MAQLTSSIKSYRGTSVASGVILDSEASGNVFSHRGRNLHHFIMVGPALAKKVSILYSFDGTNFFSVFTAATNGDNVIWDTGRHSNILETASGLAGGGGITTCPPAFVKITVDGGDLEELNVRTYGTTVR
jgi:hypothetical protein